jgi:hypothetical protein
MHANVHSPVRRRTGEDIGRSLYERGMTAMQYVTAVLIFLCFSLSLFFFVVLLLILFWRSLYERGMTAMQYVTPCFHFVLFFVCFVFCWAFVVCEGMTAMQ